MLLILNIDPSNGPFIPKNRLKNVKTGQKNSEKLLKKSKNGFFRHFRRFSLIKPITEKGIIVKNGHFQENGTFSLSQRGI